MTVFESQWEEKVGANRSSFSPFLVIEIMVLIVFFSKLCMQSPLAGTRVRVVIKHVLNFNFKNNVENPFINQSIPVLCIINVLIKQYKYITNAY